MSVPKCTDCHEPVGGQHKPHCHRQGFVSWSSEYSGIPQSARALHPEAAIAYARVARMSLGQIEADGGRFLYKVELLMLLNGIRETVEGTPRQYSPLSIDDAVDVIRWATGFVAPWKDKL